MRIAIIGCGIISKSHVGAIAQLDDVSVVACCDRDKQRAEEIAALAPGSRVYTDMAELLERERPDAVHILTPPNSHAPLAIMAMNAGCHVLVEKPMALSDAESLSMIEAARQNNVKLCTNHNYLFKPSVVKARELVESGAIGKVVHVNSYYGLSGEGSSFSGASGASHWSWRLPGGVFTNFLPHLIYLQSAFLPQLDTVAGATLGGAKGLSEQPTELVALMEGRGATGTLTISMRARPYAKFIEVYGTKGMIRADLVREVTTIHRDYRVPRLISKVVYSLEDSLQIAAGTVINMAKVAMGKLKSMPELAVLFRAFYDSIRDDREPPASGEAGRQMVAVMEQIWRQARIHPADQPPAPAPAAPEGPRSLAEHTIVAQGGIPGKVLITGATGFLGRHLVDALGRIGAEVVVLARDKDRVASEIARKATVVVGDLRNSASLEAAMHDVAVVFHCAAVTANNVPWQTHYEVNVLGTKAVFDAALKVGVQRVVHVSSVSVYGVDQTRCDGPISEEAPYAQTTDRWAYYLHSKLQADKLAFTYHHNKGLPVVVVRPGILYGPGAGRAVGRGLAQIGPLRLGIGDGQNVLPYTYIDNAVDCMLLAATNPQALGKAYNVVDEPQLSVRAGAERSALLAGERLIMVAVPPMFLNGVARLFELQRSMKNSTVPPKLSRYVIQSAARNMCYSAERARRELGWAPQVSFDEGLRKALETQQ